MANHAGGPDPESARPADRATPPPSPAARRLGGMRWLNLRLILGVALVLAAVVAGARIVAAADDTVTVWAATADLSAGVTLTEADLRQVDVQLDDVAANYLAGSELPAGSVLLRDISAGELIPAASVGDPSDEVALALSFPAQKLPVSAARGDRITVYASGEDGDAQSTTVVAEAITIVQVSGRSDGALSVGAAELQVVVAVPSCAVQSILQQTNGKVLTAVVLHDSASASTLC